MLLSRKTTRCREFPGPTPHSVAVRAKPPPSRPVDQLIRDRQKLDAAREEVLDFRKERQICSLKASWLQSSERSFMRGAVLRGVRAAVEQQEVHVQERRDRLRVLLEVEEQQLLQEMEEKMETSEEKQAKLRERARILRERRERDRQQLVSARLEQLFREQCEEARTVQYRRREEQVCRERAAQVRSRQEQLQVEQQEEKLLDELWEADGRAKEEQEVQRVRRQQERNKLHLDFIRSQMEAAEQKRRQHKELREEEAELMRQQQHMHQLQQQREQQQKLLDRQTRRRQLDRCWRLKMKRLTREQQDELRLDMNILQQLLQQETQQRQEVAQRKAQLREEQQGYRQYLADELQKQKEEEEEIDRLMEEKLKEVWTKREEQSRLRREARNRLMKEVMESQSLQIQHKLDMNQQKQLQLAAERDEMNRLMEEMKLMDEEEKKRKKQTCEAYQADLRAQMKRQQHLRCEQRAEAEREHQQGLIQQELYNQRRDKILSGPPSPTATPRPMNQAEGSRSAPSVRFI